jgi:hypothetical protein
MTVHSRLVEEVAVVGVPLFQFPAKSNEKPFPVSPLEYGNPSPLLRLGKKWWSKLADTGTSSVKDHALFPSGPLPATPEYKDKL